MSQPQPIFLVSCERSGSTMLRLMLDHHPQVSFAHEREYLVDLTPDEARAALRQAGKPYYGATLHHHFDKLPSIWPNAQYIHLIRDPRYVAKSILQKGWAGNYYTAADWWPRAEAMWDALAIRLRTDQHITITYEALVQDPPAVLTQICNFIGVRYDPAMLDYNKSAMQYPKPFMMARSLPRAKFVQQIEQKAGSLMEQRGYKRLMKTSKVSNLQHYLYVVQSKLLHFVTRCGVYGIGTVLLDLVGRRLHNTRTVKFAGRRIAEKNRKLLELEAAGLTAPSANIHPARLGTSP